MTALSAEFSAEDQPVAVVLLIEDDISRRDGLASLLSAAGYRCLSVNSVEQAIDQVKRENIDLLIATTGNCICEQVEKIKDVADVYLPTLVVVDDVHANELVECGVQAVDDFIARPISGHLMLTKMRSLLRLRHLHLKEIESRNQLMLYWQKLDLEQEVAAKIFNNVLKSNYLETEVVKTVLSPMALFNGDLVLVTRTPNNHLYLLLGDFTGHGLSASIAATPAADVFYGMSKKGFALSEIVVEINMRLYRMLPANMFLAATAVALNPDSKTMSVITCGLPEHLLINHANKTVIRLQSKNIPLGIQSNMELQEQIYSVSHNECLYLMTDGVFEAESLVGEPFGEARVIDAIMTNAETDIELLRQRLGAHCQGMGQQDDLTIVKLVCDVENAPWAASYTTQSAPVSSQYVSLTWKTIMQFDSDALKLVNPVPLMVNALMDIQGLQVHRQAIFMIVSELFANALDHGLLKLDSSMKSSPDGFMRFYELKEKRLAMLDQGQIRLLFAHQPTESGGRLTIKVKDTGEGFDWRGKRDDLSKNHGFCRRGLALVKALCTTLNYQGRGNRVTAVFDWKH